MRFFYGDTYNKHVVALGVRPTGLGVSIKMYVEVHTRKSNQVQEGKSRNTFNSLIQKRSKFSILCSCITYSMLQYI